MRPRTALLLVSLIAVVAMSCAPPAAERRPPSKPLAFRDKLEALGTFDDPAPDSVVSGQLHVAGWAIGVAFPAKQRFLLLDGAPLGPALAAGYRPDVAKVYPGWPGVDHAGFSGQVDLSVARPGIHRIAIRVELGNGAVAVVGERPIRVL